MTGARRVRADRSPARACVLALIVAGGFGGPVPSASARQVEQDPDALYAQREDVVRAREAATIWEQRLASDARDFEAAWKLARASYWLGGHVAAADQRRWYERGIEAGTTASGIEPKRPEGHFWTAANMGALAESFGVRAGLKYRGAIKRELETVLALDPAFQAGSADRALGRWYAKVPGLFGGSKTKSVEHLQKSLTYNPDSTASHFFLAETYFDMDRDPDARRELQKVLDAPIEPDFAPESREFREKARVLLARRR